MVRVLIAECMQETSTFNPVPTRFEDFDVARGQGMLSYHREASTEVGGALSVFAQPDDLEVIPTFSARAVTSGGPLASPDWQRMRHEFQESLFAAPEPDGAYFAFHGAMVAGDEPDPEGALLAVAREALGEGIPIIVSLDLHGILTDRILQLADAVVVYHTYPHVDFFETGARAARLLLRVLAGQARPVTARVFVPALVRGDELITATGRFGEVVRAAQAVEQSGGGLSAGMFIGNPFTDVPALGTNSLVVTDDLKRSEREAVRLAEQFWEMRHYLHAPLTSLAETVRIARDTLGSGTVILTDAADATSSGASGDSLAVVTALLEGGYRGRTLAPVVDAPAVAAAMAAGVGKTVKITAGGALDPSRFTPLPVTARVRMLSDGRFREESHGTEWDGGNTAVLELEDAPVTLVVTSRPVSLYNRSLFLAHGQDPTHFDAVVVKSPHCQPHFFSDWAARVINVDAPGSTSADLKSLGHTRCPRPMFPLDPAVTFSPRAEVFRRPRYAIHREDAS
ncbi:MAG TPA: M81 family metallopeptidase [Thermomicrobiales bacterium]|nr:M81 family metallopeptidase [Thermomicrobiales bacterium]